MNLAEKIRMAEALTELGVDVLEAGFAIASPGDFESVKAIAESVGQRDDTPVIASLARAGAAGRRCAPPTPCATPSASVSISSSPPATCT